MSFVIRFFFWPACVRPCVRVSARPLHAQLRRPHVFPWRRFTINTRLIDESAAPWPITSPSSPPECGTCRCVGLRERLSADYSVLCFIRRNQTVCRKHLSIPFFPQRARESGCRERNKFFWGELWGKIEFRLREQLDVGRFLFSFFFFKEKGRSLE